MSANFDQFTLRALLLKKEAQEGTDAAPVPGTDALQIINGAGGQVAEQLERSIDRPFFGGNPALRIRRRMNWSGEVELIGAAAAGARAPIATLLEIAGHAETLDNGVDAIYNPISTGIPSATAWWYQGGEVQKGVGSRAQIDSITLAINDFPKASVSGVAYPTANDEAALPSTLDTSAFQTPPAIVTETATCSIDGEVIDGLSLELNMNANVPLIETTERRVTRLTARAPEGVIRIFRPNRTYLNLRDIIALHGQVPIVWTVQAGTGLGVQLTIAQAQLFDPEPTEEEGFVVWNVPFRAIPSSTGNDEYLIRFMGTSLTPTPS